MNTHSPVPASAASPDELHLGYLWTIAFVAALGGLLFGYDWVVIGGAKPFYEKFFHLTSAVQQGWVMSCALIGCLVGALSSGVLSSHFGRKLPLLLSALVFAVSSVGVALTSQIDAFVLWRMMGGLGIGLASSLSPMYIAEISPAHLRGKLVSQPVRTGHRHSSGAVSQLAHCAAHSLQLHIRRHSQLVERADGMALDVRCHHDSLSLLSVWNVLRAREPTLAGPEGTTPRGRKHSRQDRWSKL